MERTIKIPLLLRPVVVICCLVVFTFMAVFTFFGALIMGVLASISVMFSGKVKVTGI